MKTTLSFLFIITALVQPHPVKAYYILILTGLVFCLGGDVCLALPQKKMFLMGLISFLTGHLFYIFGLFYLAETGIWTMAGTVIVLGISIPVYLWLKPHLGSMGIPVAVYITIISLMVIGAFSIFGDYNIKLSGRSTVFAGALLFYVSDVFVARHRFVKEEILNRFIGLPMYYAGQFLLAFSIGLVK